MNILELVRQASLDNTEKRIPAKEKIQIKKKTLISDGLIKLPTTSIRIPKFHELNEEVNNNIGLQSFDNIKIGKFSAIDSEIYDGDIKIIS